MQTLFISIASLWAICRIKLALSFESCFGILFSKTLQICYADDRPLDSSCCWRHELWWTSTHCCRNKILATRSKYIEDTPLTIYLHRYVYISIYCTYIRSSCVCCRWTYESLTAVVVGTSLILVNWKIDFYKLVSYEGGWEVLMSQWTVICHDNILHFSFLIKSNLKIKLPAVNC